MGSLIRERRAIAVAVGALTLIVGVLVAGATAGLVSAQTPTPSSPQDQTPPTTRPHRTDFINRLAQALGKSPAEVERAFQQVHEAHKAQRSQGQQQRFDLNRLAPAATQLGVTPQQLADALRAAAQSQFGSRGSGQPGQGGPRIGQRLDKSAFFNAVAQQLGGGVTGEQVRDALRALRPTGGQRPSREQIEQRWNQHLQELATALGVTVDQLRAALQSIWPQGAPFGPRGR